MQGKTAICDEHRRSFHGTRPFYSKRREYRLCAGERRASQPATPPASKLVGMAWTDYVLH